MIRVPRSRGGPATVTEKLHEPFRLNESVATHSASVTPTGNVVPEGGEQATDTLPWPFRISGAEYVTSAPTLVRAETVTGAGQVTSGASATGGGGGVGALGVLLHPAQQVSTSSVRKTFIVSPPFFSWNSRECGDRWAADTGVPRRYAGQTNGRVAPREITFV
jgi:hypothetical protein